MTSAKTVALIVAAGRGERTGGSVPKQFQMLGGRPVIAWSHAALASHPLIDDVIVVVAGEEAGRLPAEWTHVAGGATRLDSVHAGLAAAGDATRVLVHDAARPLLSHAVIDRLLAAIAIDDGAVPALSVADTLSRGDGTLVDRHDLYRIQTPQAFRTEVLRAAHAAWPADRDATDDAQMVRALGGSIALVQGDVMLEKITYAEDFAVAEARIDWETRSASGFDVHRLEDGEELWLGGVLIPHAQGLSGHSDADVALHAITDALLGTIAAGDIGQHFPPSDPQWKGAASDQFLAHAASLVRDRGGQITFIDLTLMCEAPKIGPHREAMRRRIAAILDITEERVSVKATTTEKLGFTGRGEGIAAQALSTIRLPGWRA